MSILKAVEVINRTGYEIRSHKNIPPLRKGYYRLLTHSIGGDAPKDFVKVYEYKEARKDAPQTWPAYIAKVGHKWYPNESITEHLLTRIGECFGLNMAQSRLMRADNQIRFLSRYFLRKDESLVHGAQIFAGYLEDEDFVEAVEKQDMAREMFTFQFVREAVSGRFPSERDRILHSFVRMLAFDAIVGNNDRHYYNWGVIVHARGSRPPCFAPIYDSARALFWNDAEAKITKIASVASEKDRFLRRYIRNSKPKTGWDGEPLSDHFQLIHLIASEFPDYKPSLLNLYRVESLKQVSNILNLEFKPLMSRATGSYSSVPGTKIGPVSRCTKLGRIHAQNAKKTPVANGGS